MAISLERIPGRTIYLNGSPHLYFGGTAYLGLQSHPPFLELFQRSAEAYGLHHGSSRKSNVSLEVYGLAEQQLARWAGSDNALLMSSGFLAAQLVIQTLLDRGHPLFLLPNAHPALKVNGVFPSNSLSDLEQKIGRQIQTGGPLPVLLFDTIDFSTSLYPHFEALKKFPLDRVILVGDDSHGIGIVGSDGGGCYGMLRELRAAKLLVCCSLGKGPGVQAGAVFGEAEDLEILRETAFYGGASPPSPAWAGCLLEGGEIYSLRRQKLMENYKLFKARLHSLSQYDHLEGHPTFEFGDPNLARTLEQKGFVITNFNYPNAQGPLVGRIVLSAHHRGEDIEQLADCLNDLSLRGPLGDNP